MGEKKTNPIFINNVEYDHDSLTDEQKSLFSHCIDLDRKIANTAFALDQLNVGKQAFFERLKAALEQPAEEATAQ